MIETRAVQEVQAALMIAKAYPRDENVSYQRIMDACKNKALAEGATYLYNRGGTDVTGPTIDLLEMLCRNWGNCQAGIVEIDRKSGESTVLAFAWDVETNYYDQKTFTVRHWRDTKQGGYALTDERDIYELIANMGARRKRSCMEAIIPQYIIDAAVQACETTLRSNVEPLGERTKKMVLKFAEFGVTVPMIEKRLGHKLDAIAEQELIALGKIYTSLKKEGSKREQWFDFGLAPVAPGRTVAPTEPEDDVPYDQSPPTPVTGSSAAPAAGAQEHPTPAAAGTPQKKRRSKSTLVEEPLDSDSAESAKPEGTPDAAASGSSGAVQPITGYDPEVTSTVIAALKEGLQTHGFNESELMGYCVAQGLAKPTQKQIGDLSTRKMVTLCETWPDVVVEMTIRRTE